MAHEHEHQHHSGGNEYYLQQLLTVFVAGAFGVCGVLMYTLHDVRDGESVRKLTHILAEPFHVWVLAGSILLLVLTAFRGVSLWMQAGAKDDHAEHDDHSGHNHAPGEACDHSGHDHSDHDHSDHDHGNIYWRVIVLAFPIALLVMGLPNRGFSDDRTTALLGKANDLGALNDVASKEKSMRMTFDELATTAYRADTREEYTGYEVTIQGKFQSLNSASGKEFTLFAEKMTCCASDQILLKARGVVPNPSQLDPFKMKGFPMVLVTGRLQFAEDSPGNYIPVLRVNENGIALKGKK